MTLPIPPAATASEPSEPRPDLEAIENFRAAMLEIDSNVDVRRLMLVLANVLVPALAMGTVDCINGSSWPPELAWLPKHVIPATSGLLAVVCSFVVVILIRCHFGLVVNGAKLRASSARPAPAGGRFSGLNWFGVTTSFVALVALSAGAGAALLCWPFGWPFAVGALATPVVLGLVGLRVHHGRANSMVQRLWETWHGPQGSVLPAVLREEHARRTLDAATADISVIVTMAAALFAGLFNTMSNLGAVPDALALWIEPAAIRQYGVLFLAAWMTVSLLLSGQMVLRLRLALAEHSAVLAEIRQEEDAPWRFRPTERTFGLYMLVQVLLLVSGAILTLSLGGAVAAAVVVGALAVQGVTAYPVALALARRSAARRR